MISAKISAFGCRRCRRTRLAYLTPILPEFLPPKNPLDLGTQTIWQPELLQICVEALLRDPAIGGLAISIPPTSPRHAALYIEGHRRREQGEPQAGGAGHPRRRLAAIA